MGRRTRLSSISWHEGAGDIAPDRAACVLIVCRNGESEIAGAVERASGQAAVFVVSDGSSDGTAEVAARAGAEVLELNDNVGKPAAIARALRHFDIPARYATVAVVDDDTHLAPDFIRQALRRMRAGVAIVVWKTMSDWSGRVRWNPWVAARAFSYWKYQLFIRRGQSALNVMTCIVGSNSLYRTSVLSQVVSEQTPYIVDDTFWTLETHRRKLGRIVYAPEAIAWIQDPTTLRDWYRQNLRWLWGTMQGIHGHRVGRRFTLFDIAYVGLILDWALYVLAWPLMFAFTFAITADPARVVALDLGGYALWAMIGAIAVRRWRLVVLTPALIVLDWVQRVNFVHALVKTMREPWLRAVRGRHPNDMPRRHEQSRNQSRQIDQRRQAIMSFGAANPGVGVGGARRRRRASVHGNRPGHPAARHHRLRGARGRRIRHALRAQAPPGAWRPEEWTRRPVATRGVRTTPASWHRLVLTRSPTDSRSSLDSSPCVLRFGVPGVTVMST